MNIRGESIRVMHPLFQEGQGGSIPTSPLQLAVNDCRYEIAAKLNELWHSVLPRCDKGSMWRGFKAAFAATFQGQTFAVAIWSSPANQSVDDGVTCELRRFAISPDAPKNTGSRLLRVMARLLAKKELAPDVNLAATASTPSRSMASSILPARESRRRLKAISSAGKNK